MMPIIVWILLLTAAVAGSPDSRFFISAPTIFHVGVKEQVFVQMGKNFLNQVITLSLEHETTNTVVSNKAFAKCTAEEKGDLVELMVDPTKLSDLSKVYRRPNHLMLVADIPSIGRNKTRVLLSQHQGYIFIQTDQPVYKPKDKVQYRIFTLDHQFRPSEDVFHLSVFNAAGNRIMKTAFTAKEGLIARHFVIPDVAKTGMWKIMAHYEGDMAHAVSREFKVQKFVMPSFEVSIQMDHNFVLVKDKDISFKIIARYSHGHFVSGAYHCQFGVIQKGSEAKAVYIRGMEQTGSVTDGIASFSVDTSKLNTYLQSQLNRNLSELEDRGELLYFGVFVTDIQSGEIQERVISIPVVSHKYTIDLSRTRAYFITGYPVNVAVRVRLPDGSPAEKVAVTMTLMEETKTSHTNQQGAVFHTFNAASRPQMTLEVTIDDSRETKLLKSISSLRNSYLYISADNKEYTVGEVLKVTFYTKNAPQNGFIHFLVLSRGAIIKEDHVALAETSVKTLMVTQDMVPSFRLIGYFYNHDNNIISDSVWRAVRDNCEEKVTVEVRGSQKPRSLNELNIDLNGQEATVALLAVDKAFYGLNTDNKLTPEQVYSTMESYDLGCSYGGGLDPESVMVEAGLSFVTNNNKANWRKDLNCHMTSRQKRAVDLEQEMMTLKSRYKEETLQNCCARGFLLIPMNLTCEERAKRVSQVQQDPSCTDAFRFCCQEGQRLREQWTKEEAKKGLGRTASLSDIEEYFLNNEISLIRRHFSSSFAFTSFLVKGSKSHPLPLPDSITTWEIQVVTLSKASGLCIKTPTLLSVHKTAFVSLRLPYSVKKYEQMHISPVIYNYDTEELQVAVHMAQSEGLCSPGSATSASFVNITVSPDSSQSVTFSAVPMKTGSIPIAIRLYDIKKHAEIDAIEKILNVWTEGVEKTEEFTDIIYLNGTGHLTRTILNGKLPDNTVPESSTDMFISLEDNGYGVAQMRNLLSPETVAKLIKLPQGCLEQTTSKLAPTAIAVRYLDRSDQWFTMPPGARDDALNKIGNGIDWMVIRLNPNKANRGAYGSWPSLGRSTWLTAHVTKMLALLGKQQLFTFGPEGRKALHVPLQEISESVRYLCSKQNPDGTFGDDNAVLHRNLNGKDSVVAMTAFVTLALSHSLELLEEEGDKAATEVVISKATSFLWSHFEDLTHPFAVAITAYSLSGRMANELTTAIDWSKFKAADKTAITVETTAYALLTAVALQEQQQAHKLAQWLTMQENYLGGFQSTQDTLVALEALSEYELLRSVRSDANIEASFRIQGRQDIRKLQLENKVKVETNLKAFVGRDITAEFNGRGEAKIKVYKVYHLMEPKDVCDKLSIDVTVRGKVKYTVKIQENYDYYDYDDTTTQHKETRVARSAIEWFDIRTRSRRDVHDEQISDQFVTYEVCVKHSPDYELSGMAIVDLTLLSGFVAEEEDLEKLKTPPEQYISHYELSHGKVLIYLNQLVEARECFAFDAIQLYAVGLLQPAPAAFYDYYEPNQKCTVFYSAPQRSKVISKLCSGDVCQCAERPCHKLQNTFKHAEEDRSITLTDREDHACFYPIVNYAYMVTVTEVSEKNNFELYKTTITDILKIGGDHRIKIGSHRIFAKRRQCKSKLDVGTEYLIMGKDGSTTDAHGQKQYLLEVSTWVEPKPVNCEKTGHTSACNAFAKFVEDFKAYSCKQ